MITYPPSKKLYKKKMITYPLARPRDPPGRIWRRIGNSEFSISVAWPLWKVRAMESPGEWLENALFDLCQKIETGLGLGLDKEIISGLVSYCDLADPRDAKEYLDVILLSIPFPYSTDWWFYFLFIFCFSAIRLYQFFVSGYWYSMVKRYMSHCWNPFGCDSMKLSSFSI